MRSSSAARFFQLGKVGAGLIVEAHLRVRPALDPREPDPIGDQEMIERAVNRAEERLARPVVLVLGQLLAGRVQPPIGPAIVARHPAQVLTHHGRPDLPWPDHAGQERSAAGHGQAPGAGLPQPSRANDRLVTPWITRRANVIVRAAARTTAAPAVRAPWRSAWLR